VSLLDKLLNKFNVNNIEELSTEERETFEHYQAVLKGEELTVDSIKNFCESQINIIESSCDGRNPLTMMQQACLHVYINILKVIDAPSVERESLERMLVQLIKE
jgi:hypothetical protein